jgi:hypothetical protein
MTKHEIFSRRNIQSRVILAMVRRVHQNGRAPMKGLVMSDLAKKFLAKWEFEHIEVVARSHREDQAQRLALRCREDAATSL